MHMDKKTMFAFMLRIYSCVFLPAAFNLALKSTTNYYSILMRLHMA